ncbi:MAG: hypothetical protein V3U98_11580 [Acidobacteriota bacterium]
MAAAAPLRGSVSGRGKRSSNSRTAGRRRRLLVLAGVLACGSLLAAPALAGHPRNYHRGPFGHHGHGRHYGYPHQNYGRGYYNYGIHFSYGYPVYAYPAFGYYRGWPYAYTPVYVPMGMVPRAAVVDLDVKPKNAEVWLDGDLIGIVDDFDGYPDVLVLRPGKQTVVLRLEGYKDLTLRLDLQAGDDFRVRRRMVRSGSAEP